MQATKGVGGAWFWREHSPGPKKRIADSGLRADSSGSWLAPPRSPRWLAESNRPPMPGHGREHSERKGAGAFLGSAAIGERGAPRMRPGPAEKDSALAMLADHDRVLRHCPPHGNR